MTNSDIAELVARFGTDRVRQSVPLAGFTTFRVGGPADYLVETTSSAETCAALTIARRCGVPVFVMGGGSNLLVSDDGIRGLVVRPRAAGIDLAATGRVRAEAGATINGVVRWAINRGYGGLEAWAGTPGTVGGAVYGNAHYAGHCIGELIAGVRAASVGGDVVDFDADALEFGYDRSRFQRTHEVILSATFRMCEGADPAALRDVARRSLEHRKRTQPLHLPSAGCIFMNPDPAKEALPPGIPASAGALIDRAGLKGHAIGGARVSPVHANFIVNEGAATASDIRKLIDLCRETVEQRFGVVLREEVVTVGEW